MRRNWLIVPFAMLGASANGADTSWPTLPTSGFISGRLATEDDFKNGDALFLSPINDQPSGVPASIHVPQYAFFIDDDGKRIPVVVVQAEKNERFTIVGMRDAHGQTYVATEAEVILLGSKHP